MLLYQKTLLQEAVTAVSCTLFFVLREERPTNQLKGNTVVVKLDVILSLTLSMTTIGKKTTLFTHVAIAELSPTNTRYKKIQAPAEVRCRIPAK